MSMSPAPEYRQYPSFRMPPPLPESRQTKLEAQGLPLGLRLISIVAIILGVLGIVVGIGTLALYSLADPFEMERAIQPMALPVEERLIWQDLVTQWTQLMLDWRPTILALMVAGILVSLALVRSGIRSLYLLRGAHWGLIGTFVALIVLDVIQFSAGQTLIAEARLALARTESRLADQEQHLRDRQLFFPDGLPSRFVGKKPGWLLRESAPHFETFLTLSYGWLIAELAFLLLGIAYLWQPRIDQLFETGGVP